MGFLVGITALLSIAITTYAAPYDQQILNKQGNGDPRITDGSHGGLYLCSGAGFVGHCEYYRTPFGSCGMLIAIIQASGHDKYSLT